MRLGLVAALLTLSLLPTASAQAPDPGALVLLACDAVEGIEPQARDALPVCPRGEPAAPAPADDDASPAPPADAPAPEQAQRLVEDVVEEVSAIPDDPAGAPERLRGLVDLLVGSVKDLLELPVDAARGVGAGLADAGLAAKAAAASVGDAVTRAADAVSSAAGELRARLASLFERETAPAAPDAPGLGAPAIERPLDAANGLLARAKRLADA